MPHEDIVLDPVDHITVDALGKPGKRIFYLQALKGKDRISLLIEKFQLQSLLEGAKEFFTEINSRYPHLEETFIDFKEEDMRIDPPVDPLFRSGDMGLAYDENRDRVCVFAQEAIQNSEERRMVRFWCNRAQLALMTKWGAIIIQRGRQICPQCSQPMETEGHFCPKKNGHKRRKKNPRA